MCIFFMIYFLYMIFREERRRIFFGFYYIPGTWYQLRRTCNSETNPGIVKLVLVYVCIPKVFVVRVTYAHYMYMCGTHVSSQLIALALVMSSRMSFVVQVVVGVVTPFFN